MYSEKTLLAREIQTGSVQEVVSKEKRCNRRATRRGGTLLSQGQRRKDLMAEWGITVGRLLDRKGHTGNWTCQSMQLFAYKGE